jgi:hypothetical protein
MLVFKQLFTVLEVCCSIFWNPREKTGSKAFFILFKKVEQCPIGAVSLFLSHDTVVTFPGASNLPSTSPWPTWDTTGHRASRVVPDLLDETIVSTNLKL